MLSVGAPAVLKGTEDVPDGPTRSPSRPNILRLPSHVSVSVVTTPPELSSCVEFLLSECSVIGLDVEWKPGSKLPALLQVGSEDHIFLIDLVALRDSAEHTTVPASLLSLLSDDSLVRLGWRFGGDLKVLREWMPSIEAVAGYCEVADIPAARSSSKSAGTGLAGFVGASLGVELCKAEQCSDWEKRPLSREQREYAALDVYILLLLAEEHTTSLHSPYTLTSASQTKNDGGSGSGGRKAGGGIRFVSNPAKSLSNNTAKREAFIARFCVKNEAYSNSRIYSSSGALVAHCDRSKALWYLSKGLATHVSGRLERGPALGAASQTDGEPLTVQLTFSPEERHHGEEGFEALGSLLPRQNICVVCGTDANLSRYHVLPRSYQKHFVTREKAHRSHDILLMCVYHHEECNRHVMELKMRIAEEYNAPLDGIGRIAPTPEERNVVKSASVFVRQHQGGIPQDRVELLENTVRMWWNMNKPEELVHLDALDAAALEFSSRLGRPLPKKGKGGWQAVATANENFKSHGEMVVEKLNSQGQDAVHLFVYRWRKHFCRALAPRHLPDDFSLLHRVPALTSVPSEFGGDIPVRSKSSAEAKDRELVLA